MLKLCVAFLFCLISTIANAEPFKISRPALCEKANTVLKELTEKFGEKPVWQGKNNQGLFTLILLNPNSETWSVIITDGEFACVIDSGTRYIGQKPEPKTQGHKSADPKDLRDL